MSHHPITVIAAAMASITAIAWELLAQQVTIGAGAVVGLAAAAAVLWRLLRLAHRQLELIEWVQGEMDNPASNASLRDELESLTTDMASLRAEVEGVKDQMIDQGGELRSMKQEVTEQGGELSRLVAEQGSELSRLVESVEASADDEATS